MIPRNSIVPKDYLIFKTNVLRNDEQMNLHSTKSMNHLYTPVGTILINQFTLMIDTPHLHLFVRQSKQKQDLIQKLILIKQRLVAEKCCLFFMMKIVLMFIIMM